MKSIKILDHFEGAMINGYSINKNNIYIYLKKEKPTIGYRNKKFNYNLHFHFGIKNKINKKININIFIECKNEDELQQSLPWLWVSHNINHNYNLDREIIGKTDFHGKYYFKLSLELKEILYIANFPPIRFSKLKKIVEDLSKKSHAKKVVVGHTVENQYINAYEYGDIYKKPTILLVSGFHPPERDTIASEAIMEKLINKKWREKILDKYSVSLIPVLNPDGFSNVMQGSNISEINLHWKFFGNTIEKCPEAHYIWEYCQKIKPIIFFDFHAFTFQNNEPRPNWIPKGYYGGRKAKLIQNTLNKELRKLCNGNFKINEAIFSPYLLATGLRKKIGTIIAPKFHLHMKKGMVESKKMAIDCLEIIINILNQHKVCTKEDILIKPFGNNKQYLHNIIKIKFLDYWYLKLKPMIRIIYIFISKKLKIYPRRLIKN
jgi:hypothetical protein